MLLLFLVAWLSDYSIALSLKGVFDDIQHQLIQHSVQQLPVEMPVPMSNNTKASPFELDSPHLQETYPAPLSNGAPHFYSMRSLW
jgi:hypothetical protein